MPATRASPAPGTTTSASGWPTGCSARFEKLRPRLRVRDPGAPRPRRRASWSAATPTWWVAPSTAAPPQLHQQLVFRPMPGLGRAETPVRGLYLASASAHPGGGVHGAAGNNAARAGTGCPTHGKVQAMTSTVSATVKGDPGRRLGRARRRLALRALGGRRLADPAASTTTWPAGGRADPPLRRQLAVRHRRHHTRRELRPGAVELVLQARAWPSGEAAVEITIEESLTARWSRWSRTRPTVRRCWFPAPYDGSRSTGATPRA